MAEAVNPYFAHVARPYALAAFEVAHEKQELESWKAFLDSAAFISQDPTVVKLLSDPEISIELLYKLFAEILAPLLNLERQNFLQLLSQNKRFIVLPNIADLFNDFYAVLEKISTVRVITAVDIEDAFKQKLMGAIERRLQRNVTLQCEVDPSIIGGAIIQVDDRVIDGSVRGQLSRLLKNLTG